MPENPTQLFNRALMKLSRRAEKADPDTLVKTFVNVGPLFDLLSIVDHQIIFGRRGTGKTHALHYLADAAKSNGDVVSYSDLSNLGSSGGIYSDHQISLAERATRLLVDALLDIHDNIYETFVDLAEEFDLSQTGPLLDKFAEAVTTVQVFGTVEQESSGKTTLSQNTSQRAGFEVSGNKPKGSAQFSNSDSHSEEISGRRKTGGIEKHTVHFGAIRRVLEQMAEVVYPKKILVIFDAYPSIPH